MIVFNVFIFVSPLFSSKCFSRWITSHTECNHSAKPGTDRTALRKSLIIQPIANRRRNARRLHTAAGLNLQVNPVTKRLTIEDVMNPRLLVITGREQGASYPIDMDSFAIGRDARNQLSLTDASASREHCVILRQGDDFLIRDMGSFNGTLVNDERVTESVLVHGDRIKIGKSLLRFLTDEETAWEETSGDTRTIEAPKKRRTPTGYVEIVGASQHNLRDVDVKVPLGVLTCVTGVSGSGKSTLVNEVLFKSVASRLHRARRRPGAHRAIHGLDQLDKIIAVDQSPIGRTPRSNPATYTGLFDVIRDLFSKTQEARTRGYKPGRFSFNVKGGRCEVCKGDGQIKIEMHFLPDVYVPCEQCHGKRYNRETLEVKFKGKSIADVLDMAIEDALGFFEHIPKVRRRLETLNAVGLGYVRLGQPATTLSGGEAQRVKLATELSKVATGRTLYILDEPTTGLHFADVQRLLDVLQRLVDAGNSVRLAPDARA